MAIQSSYVAEDLGLTAPEAYTKLASFYIENNEPKKINVFTETYFNAAARTSGKQVIGRNAYIMPWVVEVTFTDIYTFIKAQAEFPSAVDVI